MTSRHGKLSVFQAFCDMNPSITGGFLVQRTSNWDFMFFIPGLKKTRDNTNPFPLIWAAFVVMWRQCNALFALHVLRKCYLSFAKGTVEQSQHLWMGDVRWRTGDAWKLSRCLWHVCLCILLYDVKNCVVKPGLLFVGISHFILHDTSNFPK